MIVMMMIIIIIIKTQNNGRFRYIKGEEAGIQQTSHKIRVLAHSLAF
jgi:hypothetical protein